MEHTLCLQSAVVVRDQATWKRTEVHKEQRQARSVAQPVTGVALERAR